MHPVELAWRQFRQTSLVAIMHEALNYRPYTIRKDWLSPFPPEVLLPVTIPYHFLNKRCPNALLNDPELIATRSQLAGQISLWAAYRKTKAIYQIDPYLANCLSRTPWPDYVPTAALRLPRRAIILDFTWSDSTAYIGAHYDWAFVDFKPAYLALILHELTPQGWSLLSMLDLRQPTLLSAANHTGCGTFDAERHKEILVHADVLHNSLAGLALNVLLYLSGEPDIVRHIHPGSKPVLPAKTAKLRCRDPNRYQDLLDPHTFSVGTTFRRAIERWEVEQAGNSGLPTGYVVKPHMRAGHWHLYWTGKHRKEPKVNFLLPISVKGGKIIEEPERPIETRVT